MTYGHGQTGWGLTVGVGWGGKESQQGKIGTTGIEQQFEKNFFKKVLFIYLFIYLFIRERGREGEIEGEKHQCVVASHMAPSRDLVCNPGMCLDWELNQ